VLTQDDQRGIVRCDDDWDPGSQCPEGELVGPVGVDNFRPAPQKCLRHELPLHPEPVAGGVTQPEGPNVNRQPITAQHDLAREIWVERDNRDVVTTRYQGSDLGKWRDAAEPWGNSDGLVE